MIPDHQQRLHHGLSVEFFHSYTRLTLIRLLKPIVLPERWVLLYSVNQKS
jgi:hypothetical protein